MRLKTPSYITTSWDDGHPLDLRLAELLHKYGLPATFYVPLYREVPVLGPREVHELSFNFEIGAHTVHHRSLLGLHQRETLREIVDCKSALEQMTGRSCTAFCFPFGSFRRSHLRQVRQAGYRVARTVELMSVATPHLQEGLAILPTTLQALPVSFSRFARNSLRRLRPINFYRYIRYRKPDWVATAEAVLEHVLRHGGVFHLFGHSEEIDGMGQWRNVERVFAQLAQCRKQAEFVDNTTLGQVAVA